MRSVALMLSALLPLASCAARTASNPEPADRVTFAVTGCFGECPSFTISIARNGTGQYDGQSFVAVKGRRTFSASPAQVSAFLNRIAPFRPEGTANYDMQHCSGPVATDNPSVTVTWQSAGGGDTLNWYLGCREQKLMAIKPDLYGAWKELPLGNLVGRAAN